MYGRCDHRALICDGCVFVFVERSGPSPDLILADGGMALVYLDGFLFPEAEHNYEWALESRRDLVPACRSEGKGHQALPVSPRGGRGADLKSDVYMCLCVCVSVCVCVCLQEKDRERGSVSLCVFVCLCVFQ